MQGGVDAAAAIALFDYELLPIVAGLVSIQSPFGGAVVAADLLEDLNLRQALEIIAGLLLTKTAAVHDLTYAARQAFLRAHPVPRTLPTVCFSSWTEGNMFSPFYLTAAYIRHRYGARSDGLVCVDDSELPGCLAVRFSAAEMDHLAAIYPAPPSVFALRRAVGMSTDHPGSKGGRDEGEDMGGAKWRENGTQPLTSASPAGGDICEALVRLLIRQELSQSPARRS